MSETQKRQNRRKFLQGIVLSDKMQKTRIVQVKFGKKHPKYHKIIIMASKYKAHDEKNESKKGDTVRIMETRPLSKDKRWIVLNVIKTSQEEQ